jgi:hypothetical protein
MAIEERHTTCRQRQLYRSYLGTSLQDYDVKKYISPSAQKYIEAVATLPCRNLFKGFTRIHQRRNPVIRENIRRHLTEDMVGCQQAEDMSHLALVDICSFCYRTDV